MIDLLLNMQVLEGHTDEIFSCAFNYEGDTILTGIRVTSLCVCTGPDSLVLKWPSCPQDECGMRLVLT